MSRTQRTVPGPVAVTRSGNRRAVLDRPAHLAGVIAACIAVASCSSRTASKPTQPARTTSPASARSTTPTATTPVDPAVTTTAAQVVAALLAGGLDLACRDSLCTPQLASSIDLGKAAIEATAGNVVDVRALSNDGRIATVEVWIEDQNAEGSLRSYQVTLVRLSDASWRAAWVSP